MVQGKIVDHQIALAIYRLRRQNGMTFGEIGKRFGRTEDWARKQYQKVESGWIPKQRGAKRIEELDDPGIIEHVRNCAGRNASIRDMMAVMKKRGYQGCKETLRKRLPGLFKQVCTKTLLDSLYDSFFLID